MKKAATGETVPIELRQKICCMYVHERLSADDIKKILGNSFPWSKPVIYGILDRYRIPRRNQKEAMRLYMYRMHEGIKQLELPL